VTAAARLLGFRHHQSLISLIASRHKELIETGARKAVRARRHHIIAHPKRARKREVPAAYRRDASPISILHVEDNPQKVKLINDIVASEEWRVELCADGYSALDKTYGQRSVRSPSD
jgi:hypothetical protein